MGWEMNDGTKSVGMAATVTSRTARARFKELRLKPMTAAEKADAKKLDPPPRAGEEGSGAGAREKPARAGAGEEVSRRGAPWA